MFVFERAQIAIDLGEVFGQLRLARAQVLARRGDDRWAESEARGNLQRQAAARVDVARIAEDRRERIAAPQLTR